MGLLSYQPHSESAPVNGQPGMNMQFDASGVPKGILLKIKMHRSLDLTFRDPGSEKSKKS